MQAVIINNWHIKHNQLIMQRYCAYFYSLRNGVYMAGNITVAIVIILIIGGIIFGCWVDRADTKIADRKNEATSDKQTAGK